MNYYNLNNIPINNNNNNNNNQYINPIPNNNQYINPIPINNNNINNPIPISNNIPINRQVYFVYPERHTSQNTSQNTSLCCVTLWLVGLFIPFFSLLHYIYYTCFGNQAEKYFAKSSLLIFITHVIFTILIVFMSIELLNENIDLLDDNIEYYD
jgi:hypothetical protein